RLAGRSPEEGDGVAVGEWIVAPAELERVRELARRRVDYAPVNTVAAEAGVEVAQLRAAVGDEVGASPLGDPAARRLIAELNAAPFSPPAPDSPALVR